MRASLDDQIGLAMALHALLVKSARGGDGKRCIWPVLSRILLQRVDCLKGRSVVSNPDWNSCGWCKVD